MTREALLASVKRTDEAALRLHHDARKLADRAAQRADRTGPVYGVPHELPDVVAWLLWVVAAGGALVGVMLS